MTQGNQFLFELHKIINEFNHLQLNPNDKIEMKCFDSHIIMANNRITPQYDSQRLFEIIQNLKNFANIYFQYYNLTPSCVNFLFLIDILYSPPRYNFHG